MNWILEVRDTFLFLRLAYRCYRLAQKWGTHYGAVTRHGVPRFCLFVGVGREAWRITQSAIDKKEFVE